jgi:hypothetical protein
MAIEASRDTKSDGGEYEAGYRGCFRFSGAIREEWPSLVSQDQ